MELKNNECWHFYSGMQQSPSKLCRDQGQPTDILKNLLKCVLNLRSRIVSLYTLQYISTTRVWLRNSLKQNPKHIRKLKSYDFIYGKKNCISGISVIHPIKTVLVCTVWGKKCNLLGCKHTSHLFANKHNYRWLSCTCSTCRKAV